MLTLLLTLRRALARFARSRSGAGAEWSCDPESRAGDWSDDGDFTLRPLTPREADDRKTLGLNSEPILHEQLKASDLILVQWTAVSYHVADFIELAEDDSHGLRAS